MSLLVALDFSDVTEEQLVIVARLAAPNRQIYLLHVAEPEPSFVGFDAGPDQVLQLQAGDVQALVAQQPFTIGELGIEQAVAALTGGEVTPEIQTESTVVTMDNIDSWLPS